MPVKYDWFTGDFVDVFVDVFIDVFAGDEGNEGDERNSVMRAMRGNEG